MCFLESGLRSKSFELNALLVFSCLSGVVKNEMKITEIKLTARATELLHTIKRCDWSSTPETREEKKE